MFLLRSHQPGIFSMLSLSLHRAQLELQSHRLWLRRFASGVRFLSSPPSAGAHPLAHHGITRQIGTQNALQTSTRASFSTKKVKSRKRAKSANIQSPVQRYDLLPGLQQAVQEVDVETIAALYRGQEDKSCYHSTTLPRHCTMSTSRFQSPQPRAGSQASTSINRRSARIGRRNHQRRSQREPRTS